MTNLEDTIWKSYDELTEKKKREEYISLNSRPLTEYNSTKNPPIKYYGSNIEKIIFREYSLEKIFEYNSMKNSPIELYKNKLEMISPIKNFLENIIIPSYSLLNKIKIQVSPLGINLGVDTDVNADNLGEFALPIVEYIKETKPDYVIASDRGARLLGLAVHRLYTELYGTFPTQDGRLNFRRFSKSNTQEQTEKHLKPLIDEMLKDGEKKTVLILDDWVCSGGTKRLAQQVFDKLSKGKIKIKFGVLIGKGGDVSGNHSRTSQFAGLTDWRDDSNIIGVEYSGGIDDYKFGKDFSTPIKAKPVRSQESLGYRTRMYKGIGKLVNAINEGKYKDEPKTTTQTYSPSQAA